MGEFGNCGIESESGGERCFGCKNRTTLHEAIVIEGGFLCCRRCAERRRVVRSEAFPGWSVEIVG